MNKYKEAGVHETLVYRLAQSGHEIVCDNDIPNSSRRDAELHAHVRDQ